MRSQVREREPSVISAGWLWFFAGLICCGALLSVWLYRYHGGHGYPLDDSWIHLTFARNLAEGNGFGINPGEQTPGATSPLWIVLLSVGFLFGAEAEPWPWVLDGCVLALCGLMAAGLCRALQPGRRGSWFVLVGSATCGLAAASFSPIVWSAAGAMEVPLVSTLLLAAVWAFCRARDGDWKHALGWGVCAGLAANARPEGLLLIPILSGLDVASGPRTHLKRAVVGAATALLLTVPYGVFCLYTSGRWFPNTYYAKTLSSQARLPNPEDLRSLAGHAWSMAPEALLLLLLALAALMLWRKQHIAVVPVGVLLYVFALPLGHACMHRCPSAGVAGNFGRYLIPIFPMAFAVGYAGLLRLGGARAGRLLPLAAALGTIPLLTSVWRTIDQAHFYAHNVRDINGMQVRMAHALRDKLEPGTLVAANDIGALAYLTDFRILDLVGIASTEVLDAVRPVKGPRPVRQFELARYLARHRPEVMVIFPAWYPRICQWLAAGIQPVEVVYVADNITSGASHLVAFRINWSRVPRLLEPAPPDSP